MEKTLYCGIDLHSSNGMFIILDENDKVVFKKRLCNKLPTVLDALTPFQKKLAIVAVESTFNWYWLVDGLMDAGYPVCLANPAAIDQYDGIKQANDLTDATFIAHLARLGVLPTGYIYPKEDRPVRDLLREIKGVRYIFRYCAVVIPMSSLKRPGAISIHSKNSFKLNYFFSWQKCPGH